MNLDNSFETEQSDAYAMRLHSVHPKISVSGSPEPTMRLKGVRFFMPENSGAHKSSRPYGSDIVHISK